VTKRSLWSTRRPCSSSSAPYEADQYNGFRGLIYVLHNVSSHLLLILAYRIVSYSGGRGRQRGVHGVHRNTAAVDGGGLCAGDRDVRVPMRVWRPRARTRRGGARSRDGCKCEDGGDVNDMVEELKAWLDVLRTGTEMTMATGGGLVATVGVGDRRPTVLVTVRGGWATAWRRHGALVLCLEGACRDEGLVRSAFGG
jgi:hypothetical protein